MGRRLGLVVVVMVFDPYRFSKQKGVINQIGYPDFNPLALSIRLT